jgi:hypothetical protein
MWAVANSSKTRHFYGRGNTPLAICGHLGEEPKLDYTKVHLKKCPDCLKQFPRTEGDKDNHE